MLLPTSHGVNMPLSEMNRCANCSNECEGSYKNAALDLLFPRGQAISESERNEQVRKILTFKLKEIVRCELTEEEISLNLENLTEVGVNTNG